MNPHEVVAEARPMLIDVLSQIGLHSGGESLDLRALLEPFSRWIECQHVAEEDVAFLAGLVGAFICEYLIEVRSALREVRDGRIWIQLPFEENIAREFDPYAVAFGIAKQRNTLASFLSEVAPP